MMEAQNLIIAFLSPQLFLLIIKQNFHVQIINKK